MVHLRYLVRFGGVASALRRTAAHLPSTAVGAAQPLSAARLPAARGIAVAAALPPPALARRRPLSTGAVGTGLGSADHVVERPMHHAVFFGDMNALQAAILENLRFIEERDNQVKLYIGSTSPVRAKRASRTARVWLSTLST